MQYRDHEFQYESEPEFADADSLRPEGGKNYRAKKAAARARRPRLKKSGAHPGCGMGARRNKRWTW